MQSLSLIYYRVDEVNFKFNNNIQPNVSFQIKPKIECKVTKKGNNLFVNLILKVNEDISRPVPFDIKVCLNGTFKIENETEILNDEEKRAQVNEAFSILYPYLRAVVSGLTVQCNIPAYILPTIAPVQLNEEEEIDGFRIKKPQGLN